MPAPKKTSDQEPVLAAGGTPIEQDRLQDRLILEFVDTVAALRRFEAINALRVIPMDVLQQVMAALKGK